MVIGEYRGYVVMIAGQTSDSEEFHGFWLFVFFHLIQCPTYEGYQCSRPKKNIGLNQHMEMEAFSESFTMSLWRQVLLVKIMAENPVVFQFFTAALLHFRHRRFGLKVVHGRPQNLGKSSDKITAVEANKHMLSSKGRNRHSTDASWDEWQRNTCNAWPGLGPDFSFHRYRTIDPQDPIDPRLAQQNNATGFRLRFYHLSSSSIRFCLLSGLPSPLCQRAEQTSAAAKLNEKERALLLDPPFHCSSTAV